MKKQLLVLGFLIPFYNLQAQEVDLFDLDLGDLSDLRIKTAGSLTKTQLSKVPASVTKISNEMIRSSGARNLDELLEIYVPSFQRAKSGGAGPHFGIRGIISDIDNKTLLLVNGRVMNNKTLYGAMSERYIPLLGEIESIEVIRGPGSAIYGPGAINGVISIQTLSSKTFEGGELLLRQGIVEEFSMMELRYGHRLSEDLGVFVNLGLDHYAGASAVDAPLVFSKNGDFFSAGQDIVDPNLVNDNSSRFGKPHHKIHLHLQWKDTEIWARSAGGSIAFINNRHFVEREGSFVNSGRSQAYQQFTLAAKQTIALSDALSLTIDGGYDIFDIVNNQERAISPDFENASSIRESELSGRILLDWSINSAHSWAVGAEYMHDRFGQDAHWLSNDKASLAFTPIAEWSANTASVMTEYQWNMNENWTTFVGGRADKHSYTDWMYSPKFSIVFAPTIKHQLKLLLSRSVRKSEDPELKRQHDRGENPEIETINVLEVRNDWQISEKLSQSLIFYRYRHNILGFLPQERRETYVGEALVNGVEFELNYINGDHNLSFSHAFTDLLNFDLTDANLLNQVITSEPYGYGSELANWATHLSKINWSWKIHEKWKLNSSITSYWRFSGAKDYTNYNNEILNAINRSQSDGSTDAFKSSIFVNLGLNYQNDGMRFSLNAHNVLGLFDQDFNKRNFYARMAGYRQEAMSLSVSFSLQF